ncbi:hypothetical protein N1028_02510 [Herbiconiux sp. CPCC 203407]|jgi:hypothetical protein|uniref:Uncharacterized protein n=1 Tax=Herbiconiux oxytropis TaxID=2970915 RepID=A0AA42BTW8_9MICO|nr:MULTISPECIES: hypothetical protein [Herbiconiux]MCS5721107.1 hypothetical protein [Herbiconiux oxytropis]MCS5724759.1 hypothetical protein [Herbiconiux oxytropis]
MRSVVPVWILTIIGVVAVGVFVSAPSYLVFLPVVLGAALVVTFGIQLIVPVRKGFVNRVSASLGGAVLILALATVVLGPLAFAASARI